MLPYIIGAVVVTGVATYLNSREKSCASSYNHRLSNEHEEYSDKLANKAEDAERKKRDKLFKLIKDEQRRLERERAEILRVANNYTRYSPMYNNLQDRARGLNELIKLKQRDADMMRL